jgi:hypothetical protein
VRRGRGRGGVQCIGDCLGEFFEARGQIQVVAEPGPVEALADQCDLAAQGGYLGSQRGQALAECLRARFSLRAGHCLPQSCAGERSDR